MIVNTWDENEYFDMKWELRIKVMSFYITEEDQKVCDVGCGESKLKKYISKKMEYVGVDYKQRENVMYICDINKYEYPPIEKINDVVFCSGVLEYIHDLEQFICYLTKHAKKVIFSYCYKEFVPNEQHRKKRGWVNSLSKQEIVNLFSSFGMKLQSETSISNNGIFCFSKFLQQERTEQNKLLIIDPIYRGSRTFYSANALSATKLDRIDIITRTSALNEHTIQPLLDCESQFFIHEKVIVENGFWYGKISVLNIQNIIDCINELIKTHHYNLIYFVGLNEIFPEIFQKFLEVDNDYLHTVNMLFVEYNYDHLIELVANREHNKLKLQLQEKFLSIYQNARISVLDERVFDSKWSALNKSEYKNKFLFMSDPAAKLYETNKITKKKKIKLLLVGLQSKRKGIDNIVQFLKKYEKLLLNIEFLLVGRLDTDSEIYRSYLSECTVLDWVDGYLDEDSLQSKYQECDFVMLPYTRNFNGSSGVFAYACAHAKPIISTNHGCIGYRVQEYNLGFTFESDDLIQLYNVLQGLHSLDLIHYKELGGNAYKYALEHGMKQHQSLILKGMQGWK